MKKLFRKIKNWIENNSENTDTDLKNGKASEEKIQIERPKLTKIETKKRVFELIEKAEKLTPKTFEKDLPNLKELPNVREMHHYEHKIWDLGEKIRQLIFEHKGLRKDKELNDRIMKFCLNKNSKRGRESFIMLLWYKHNQKYAEQLVGLINDKYVYGHIIEGLNKIQIEGYCKEVSPYKTDEFNWIRKQAKKYVEKYCTQQHI